MIYFIIKHILYYLKKKSYKIQKNTLITPNNLNDVIYKMTNILIDEPTFRKY